MLPFASEFSVESPKLQHGKPNSSICVAFLSGKVFWADEKSQEKGNQEKMLLPEPTYLKSVVFLHKFNITNSYNLTFHI